MNFVLYTDGLLMAPNYYLEYNGNQQATFWPVWVAEERRCIQDCLQTL